MLGKGTRSSRSSWDFPDIPSWPHQALQGLGAALSSCTAFGRVAFHASMKTCEGVPSSPEQGASSPLLPPLLVAFAPCCPGPARLINYVLACLHQPSCLLLCGQVNYYLLPQERKKERHLLLLGRIQAGSAGQVHSQFPLLL